MITLNSVVRARANHVSCALPGGTAILDIETGVYYALDGVGTRIWQLLSQPVTAAAILDQLTGEYAVPRERCREDLLRVLEDLAKNGLIEVRDRDDRDQAVRDRDERDREMRDRH